VSETSSSPVRKPAGPSWKLALKLAVSGGLLVYLFGLVDLPSIGRALGNADPVTLAAAIVLYLAGQVVSAFKWRVLARAVGFAGSERQFVSWYFIGMFFNAFGFGTVGGDVVRALYLSGAGGRRAVALNTVLADRVSGLLVLLAIAVWALLLFRTYELPAVIYWTTLTLSAALLAGWRLAPVVLPWFLPEANRLRRLVERDLAPYWNDGGLLARVGLMSLVFHLSQLGVLALLARGLRLPVPGTYFFVFGPLVNIFSSLPISLNGLGVREGGYVFFLSHIGIDREPAIVFALSWFAIVLAAGAVGGVVYLRHGRAPRPLEVETAHGAASRT
jgi:hypothetical protein